MQKKGRLDKYFPGSNSSRGFYSLYQYLPPEDTEKILILKGGPGVGKSTFMRRTGEEMRAEGREVEYHYCASDSSSLDGVVIPQISTAIMDGTAPHIIDPLYPGVVEEIINLGEFWQRKLLLEKKGPILELNRSLKREFKMAYHRLAEARGVLKEIRELGNRKENQIQNQKILHRLQTQLLDGLSPQLSGQPQERHHFISALTPKGPVNHLENLMQGKKKIFLLQGEPGARWQPVLRGLARRSKELGLELEIYRCPLSPEEYDHLVLPQMDCAIIKDLELFQLSNKLPEDSRIEEIQVRYILAEGASKQELEKAKERFKLLIQRAISRLKRARELHQKLEECYHPAMDFQALEKRRKEIREELLSQL